MKEIFAYRLKNARIINGFSLQSLAEKIGVTKQMIGKYESAMSMPDSPHLILLAKMLGVKPDYFFRAATVSLENVKFRKKSKYSETQIKSLKAKISNQMENYLCIEDILTIQSEFTNPLKAIEITNFDDAENAASKLRKSWNLGNDPIHNIITLLESNEIKVIEVNEPDQKLFDGVSTTINDKYPVIAINTTYTIERKRFTLLHELGHLLLSFSEKFSEKEQEDLCNRFAGAMLLPENIVIKEIGRQRNHISLSELTTFQKQFGISITAIMYRLVDLKIISENKISWYFVTRNKNPKLKEDTDKARFAGDETSERYERLVYKALSQEVISISKASALLNTSVEEVRNNLAII